MLCIKCGEKLQPEADFCRNCGNPAISLSRAAPPASEPIPVKYSDKNLWAYIGGVMGFLNKNWAAALFLGVALYMGINAWTARAAAARIIGCVETIDTYVVSGFVAAARAMNAYSEAMEQCGAPWHFNGTKYALESQVCHEAYLPELLARWAQFHSLDPPTCMYEITQAELANAVFEKVETGNSKIESLTTDDLTVGTWRLKDYHKVTGSWLDRLWECENDLVNMEKVPGQRPVSCRILNEAYHHDLDEVEKRVSYLKEFVNSVHAELRMED